MARSSLQLLAMVAMLAFGVMFGITAASHGIEQVHGGVEADETGQIGAAITVSPQPVPTPAANLASASAAGYRFGNASQDAATSLPDRFADKFGRLLQITADHLVDFVVSVLNKLFS